MQLMLNSYVTLGLHVNAEMSMSTAHCYNHDFYICSVIPFLSVIIRDCAMHPNTSVRLLNNNNNTTIYKAP